MDQETFYAQVVGQVIRGTRELQGVDLATMATAAALSNSGWSRVETGETTMTLAQLRKAATRLGVEPWTIVQKADHIVLELARRDVVVHDERPRDVGRLLLGGAAILAVLAGGVVLASKSARDPDERTRRKGRKK